MSRKALALATVLTGLVFLPPLMGALCGGGGTGSSNSNHGSTSANVTLQAKEYEYNNKAVSGSVVFKGHFVSGTGSTGSTADFNATESFNGIPNLEADGSWSVTVAHTALGLHPGQWQFSMVWNGGASATCSVTVPTGVEIVNFTVGKSVCMSGSGFGVGFP